MVMLAIYEPEERGRCIQCIALAYEVLSLPKKERPDSRACPVQIPDMRKERPLHRAYPSCVDNAGKARLNSRSCRAPRTVGRKV